MWNKISAKHIQKQNGSHLCECFISIHTIKLNQKEQKSVSSCVLQSGESLQRVEGSGSDCGQLVVVQREQTDIMKACETVVVDTADLVVP